MKKQILAILMLAFSLTISGQTGTTSAGQFKMNIPTLGGVNDSIAVWNGTDKLIKYIPKSKVIDVFEYANLAGFPTTGVKSKIYTARDTNKIYRWTGSAYVELSAGGGSTPSLQAVSAAGNTITVGTSVTTLNGTSFQISDSSAINSNITVTTDGVSIPDVYGNTTDLTQGTLEFTQSTQDTQYGIGGIQLTDGTKQAVYDIDQLAYTTSTGTLIVAHGTQTANHTATFPNKTGTVAMTSDIPTNISSFTNDVPYLSLTSSPSDIGALAVDGSNASSDINISSYGLSASYTRADDIIVGGLSAGTKVGIINSTNLTALRNFELPDVSGTIALASDIPASISLTTTGSSGAATLVGSTLNVPNYTLSGLGGVAANSSITGATKTKVTYDSKGLVTAGADATTADIADSADKRYVTDANLTSIGTISSKLSGYIYKNTTAVNVTGTTSETQVLQVTIPANTFSASDIMKIEILVTKSGTAGIQTTKVKLSTSSTMPSGTTDQIATAGITNTNVYSPLIRNVLSINGGNISGYNFTTSQTTDIAQSAIAYSTKAFDVTVVNYLYVSITNASSGDTSTLRSVKISNF
jgi:hypothetical protein